MPAEDWEKWIPIVDQNRRTLEKIEQQTKEIHDVVYKNGLSAKVNILWDRRKSIDNFVKALVLAAIIGIGGFVWNKVTDDTADTLKEVVTQLKELKDQKTDSE